MNYMIFEKTRDGGIVIRAEHRGRFGGKCKYLGHGLREAEQMFRREFGLIGYKFIKIYL